MATRLGQRANKTTRLAPKRQPKGLPDFSKVKNMRDGMSLLGQLMAYQKSRGF